MRAVLSAAAAVAAAATASSRDDDYEYRHEDDADGAGDGRCRLYLAPSTIPNAGLGGERFGSHRSHQSIPS